MAVKGPNWFESRLGIMTIPRYAELREAKYDVSWNRSPGEAVALGFTVAAGLLVLAYMILPK